MSQESKKVIVCDTVSGNYYGTLNSFDSGSKCIILEDAYKIFASFGDGEHYDDFYVDNLAELRTNQLTVYLSWVASNDFSKTMEDHYDNPDYWKPIMLFRCPTLILLNVSQIIFCEKESTEWLNKIAEENNQE